MRHFEKLEKQPFCRYCGGRIGKRTSLILCFAAPPRTETTDSRGRVVQIAVPVHRVGIFRSKADVQRTVNQQIVSVRKNGDGTVDRVSVWDGMSYVDEFFCTAEHAQRFARIMAKAGHATVAYVDAAKVAEAAQ